MLVLDASVSLAWCFPDEDTSSVDAVLDHLRSSHAVVPALWPLEVANALVSAERRRRVLPEQADQFLRLLAQLPIEVDGSPTASLMPDLLAVARTYALSVYDAAYLDLAIRLTLPLATLDARLTEAAKAAGVTLFAG